MTRILVVDDDPIILTSFAKALEKNADEYEILCVDSGEEGLARLEAEPFDLLFTDLKMPGIDGLEVVRRTKEIRPDCDPIMMTGYSTVETAVDAMRYGAIDYIAKPFSKGELLHMVQKAERIHRARLEKQPDAAGTAGPLKRSVFARLFGRK